MLLWLRFAIDYKLLIKHFHFPEFEFEASYMQYSYLTHWTRELLLWGLQFQSHGLVTLVTTL